MVLYNITVSVNASLAKEWVDYMHKVHIPDVLDTGHFRDYKLCRVEADEQGGLTFAVQYVAYSVESFNKYQNECAAELQQEFIERWGAKASAFRTVLPIISEGKA